MSATFPIPNVTVLFQNGDRFETTNIDHLYNLHLELHHAYPLLTVGEFRLDFVEENEEEESAVFQLVMDRSHLRTDVTLDEMGDLWVFDIMFSWWLLDNQDDDGPYDSWCVSVAVNPDQAKRFYGRIDRDEETILSWHEDLGELIAIYPYGRYNDAVIQDMICQINKIIQELQQES